MLFTSFKLIQGENMSFATIPTIMIPGIGEMSLTTAEAIRTGQYQVAFDMMREHASLYSEAHPHFVTTLQAASLVGGAAGLYAFAPSVFAALGTSTSSLQGMTMAQLAVAPSSGVPVGATLGTGASFSAAALGAMMVAQDTVAAMQTTDEYTLGSYQRYDTQRQRWARLEAAELDHRELGSELPDESRIVHPFNPMNPFESYQEARAIAEAAAEQKRPEAEVRKLTEAACQVAVHSHFPYRAPSAANGNQGAFSDWYVQGESAFWLETFEYREPDGYVARSDADGEKFMVGVNPDKDAPYIPPGLSQSVASGITRKEDLAGVQGRLTTGQMEALTALVDHEEVAAGNEWEQDNRQEAIEYLLLSRMQSGRPTTAAALQAEEGFEETLQRTMAALCQSEVKSLAKDVELARMGLTAEYNEDGSFKGYTGLAPRRRPEAGFYQVEDDADFY